MPPGSYSGTKTRTRVSYLGGNVNWTPTRYRIELTAEQLASVGATIQPQSECGRNRTEFARQGRLTTGFKADGAKQAARWDCI